MTESANRTTSAANVPDAGFATVAVVGAGTMGAGIAQVVAASGRSVRLIDTSREAVERGMSTIQRNLDRAVGRERLGAGERDRTLERIEAGSDLSEAGGADLLIEAIYEHVGAKRSVFEAVGPLLGPDAILTSNTSSISITRLAAATPAPERFAGFHFFNPVPVLPLIEIVRGLATGEPTIARLQAFASALGKTGVVVRDSPGFVVNRLLIPMINEAVTCLQHGIAERDDIDATMRLGAGHPMGPLQLADLIGLDVCLDIMETLHRDLGEDRYRPAPLLRQMVDAGWLGRKSGRGFHDYTAD